MVTACLNATVAVMHNVWNKLAENYCGETVTETCWIMTIAMLNEYARLAPTKGQRKF